MIAKLSKRFFSFLLAMVMLVSMVPFQALAAEHDHAYETEGSQSMSAESELLVQLRTEIEQYIDTFGISHDMPDGVLANVYFGLNGEQAMRAWYGVEDLIARGQALSAKEQKALMKEKNSRLVERFYNVMQQVNSASPLATSGSWDPVTGINVNVSGATDTTHSQGEVTIKVTGSSNTSCGTTTDSSKTATAYIKNNTGAEATLSFKWSYTGDIDDVKIDNVAQSGSGGTYTAIVAAGGEIKVEVVSGKGNSKSGTAKLNSFSAVALAASYVTNFEYNSTLGSVTLNGSALTSNSQELEAKKEVTLVATPASGAQFIAWTDANDNLLSTNATFAYTPAYETTLKAVFTTNEPYFLAGGMVVKGLNEAMAKDGQTVILMNNSTLPAGNYTIPSSKTLLIPFDANNTLCTTAPEYSQSEATPSAYRTLTMAAGANIIVNGALSVSGTQVAGGANAGIPKGPLGFIKMQSGSNITVNGGANLYVWGYITGSGSVTIESGGAVYEDFQVTSWRGGTNISGMLNNSQRVFPLNQYYIQNVEVPMTLKAGAVEKGFMSVAIKVLSTNLYASTVPFIGADGMFNITSGYLVKDYNEETDRMEIEVHGDIAMKSLSLSMSGVGTIDSSKYELSVNSNISVTAKNGSTINVTQNLALLPGTEMIVEEGANLTLGDNIAIYIYDDDEWVGKGYAYASSDVRPLAYAPGRTGPKHTANTDAYVYIGGSLDASKGYVYTTAGGANVTAAEGAQITVKPGTQTVTYQATQTGNDGKTISYPSIAITPAKLMNADGSYTETASLPLGQYTYTSGKWNGTCLHVIQNKVTTAATCTDEGVKTYYCACGYQYTEAIPANGHTAGAEATCTTAQTCKNCDHVFVAALGHTPGAEATCTAAQICTVCNTELVAALGHTPGAEATCEDPQYCSVCGDQISEKLGHDLIVDEAQAPTCTEPGYQAGAHCSRCDYEEGGAEIPALGHTPGAAATCTTNQVCTVCGAEVHEALGHIEVTDEAVAPTCTETGLTAGVHCGRAGCGEILVAQEPVDALGHGALYEEELIPALCEDDGHEVGMICTVCGEYAEGGAVLPATGHKIYTVEAKIPTYTVAGWNDYEYCSQCAYTTYEEIAKIEPPHVDNYEDFMSNLNLLEEAAKQYVLQNPGLDPLNLIIKYIRTGVTRYNSGSWNIMAGYEDEGFRKFADEMEDAYNVNLPREEWVSMSSLKYIEEFKLPNGQMVDFGHMFGTMDITYHNNGSVDHADVGGWCGDLVDLLTISEAYIGSNFSSNFEENVTYVAENYLLQMVMVNGSAVDDKFSATDWYGDADAYFLMQKLTSGEYEAGDMVGLMRSYFSEDLTDVDRADFLIRNRFGGVSTRQELRDAVYNAYTSNKTIATLEATRDFYNSADYVAVMRKAVCYAFADYLCKTAGDYVDKIENDFYQVFDSTTIELAPGITQQINYATSADGKQMAYYLATADLRDSSVGVYANYASRDPQEWQMARVLDQANNMQDLYGNPESEEYVQNFNVIASINAGGFDMSNGDPGGLLVMHGETYKGIGSGGFFAITKDGRAILGATSEWSQYAGQVEEAIGGFGTLLVKDGEIAITQTSDYYTSRAPRSAVGITATGKVVFMVLDGRQEPFSCGGSMVEIAQIMYDAGCVNAINLDGGGSSTFVARQPGEEDLSVVNRPSDGYARSVSTSLVIASTAPSSTAFDHADLVSATKYVTEGTSLQITAHGISATGNAAELPEGTVWVIDDDRADWASIDENGLFTAKNRTGEVEVKLMVGDETVGKTTINIVEPDQVYFTKTALSAVYGQSVQLPVKALYQGKEVSINENDLTFTMSADAGIMNGFVFTAKENSAVKNVRITAALAKNANVTANVSINLYNQGENSFDFDQATSGDRMLAWLRTVSNATTDDNSTYTVLNAGQDMVTTYVMAMDMSQIPVPEHLEDLIYMLPGADMEDASAWSFLMQLAERVSVLTTVTPKIVFDSRFDVDISGLTLVNDYFEIKETVLDEATNTLTLTLKWKDQTAAIDPATANPLCMVSGIKLTPKADADWGNKGSMKVVHSGDISYDIYLRASGLYSFSQKVENQNTFGLYPFVNPDDPNERGGHMMSTYCTFEDSYTLVNVAKEGWVNEIGGFAYYVDGQRLTGIQKIDGIYYDFGKDGINVGQKKYTGLFYDQQAKVYRYAYIGELTSGWQMIDNEWYYFKPSTMAAITGQNKLSGIYYDFEETGRLKSGVWVNTFKGMRYYYGPDYYWNYWAEIDGEVYYFKAGYRLTGMQKVRSMETSAIRKWYEFDENGVCQGEVNGIIESEGIYYYIENGLGVEKYLIEVDGDYYFAKYDGKLVVNQTINAWATNCDMPKGTYTFGPDGKMVGNSSEGEIVEIDGILYYYKSGKGVEAGLVKVGDDYYFSVYQGRLVVDRTFNAYATSCDLPKGTYTFGPDGKMLGSSPDGTIVEMDGVLYYYESGKGVEAGLVKVGDDYYFAVYKGKLVTNKIYGAYMTSCDLPKGQYEFGADGKMLNGIVEKDGVRYYYENGKGVEAGLVKVGDDYYFAVYKGKLVTNQVYSAYMTSCDLPKGRYEFGPDGKMLNGIVDKDGVLYYYENGNGVEAGLINVDGDYYFAVYKGKLVTNQVYSAYKTSCDLPKGQYEFGADGKMLNGIVEKDGVLYYYENGKGVEAGLINVDGDYYFALYKGKLVTNQVYSAYKTSCDLPKGTYEFGADGKMVNGIVEKDGVLYYYENGQAIEKGLFELDGEYYFAAYKGKLVTNQVYSAYKTSCDLPKGQYEFGADGKMLNGIVDKDGVLYYYENGKGVEKNLFYYEGHYYFAVYKGKLVTNQVFRVYAGNGLLLEQNYTFNELGQIIG